MPSSTTDRIDGVTTSVAVKVPCRVATTANITLSGEQTIDGVACVDGDRVLVKDQSTASQNGIYVVSTGSWSRSRDFDGNRDVVTGTMVKITSGTTNGGNIAEVTTTGSLTIGTSSLAFTMRTGTLGSTSAFAATLLDDTSAFGARTTLGLNEIDVFLIAGQSNAQGSSSDPSNGPSIPSGAAYQYYSSSFSAITGDPVGNANTGSAWPAFALNYYNATGRKLCFVPAAVGGSSMSKVGQASPTWDTTGASPLGVTAVSTLNSAFTAIAAAGYTPVLRGILWSQGETDAGYIDTAAETKAQYKAAFQALLTYFRGATINCTTYPRLPVYVSKTGGPYAADTSGYQQVRAAQQEVADTDLYTVIGYENAPDFIVRGLMQSSGGNTLHYTQAGYNEMGTVMASSVINGQTSYPTDIFTYTPTWTLVNSLGNGSLNGRFTRNGRTVTATIDCTIGSTTSFNTGAWTVSLPVLAGISQNQAAAAWALDNGTGYFTGTAIIGGAVATASVYTSNGAVAWSNSVPMTWATGDRLTMTITYMV